jgi:CRP/FNR family transcriptional regulator, dissimilatory nitrate respiration regulator
MKRGYMKDMDMSEEELLGLLRECSLFYGMNDEEISLVLNGHMGRSRSYVQGSLVVQAGEEVRFLHILLKGIVKGEMIDYTGKVIKIEDIAPPRPLAPAFLFGKENRYPVNITTAEDAELLSIPRDRFLAMLQESEKVLVNFVNIVSSRGQFLSNKIKFLSFTTIKGKLAQYLLDLSASNASRSFSLPHSQSQLSELFGVARPSIGRAISELNRDGLIDTEGKQVQISDPERLSDFLQ